MTALMAPTKFGVNWTWTTHSVSGGRAPKQVCDTMGNSPPLEFVSTMGSVTLPPVLRMVHSNDSLPWPMRSMGWRNVKVDGELVSAGGGTPAPVKKTLVL